MYCDLLIKSWFSNSVDPVKNLLRETNNGSDSIIGESKDQIIINLTNNFVENKEEVEASHGILMAKVSITVLLLVIIVIVFEFQ